MIIVLGGSGYIGTAFRRSLELSGLEHWSISRRKCNYYDVKALDRLLIDARPTFLINAAGFAGRPNVDACELNKTECLLANAVLPGVIREACGRRQVPWGHVSSGCIYSGAYSDSRGFSEADTPNFCFRSNRCSFYSGAKALGEEVLQEAQKCYIWRLRVPFNEIDHDRNYLSKLLRYARLLDVRNSLSHLDECVAACIQGWMTEIPFGTYHLTNTDSITTRQVVSLILRNRVSCKQFDFFESEDEFMQCAAITPRSHCVLDNRKALASGLRLSHVAEAIERSLLAWKSH